MGPPDFPTPVGVFRSIELPSFDDLLLEQVRAAQAERAADLNALYRQAETWVVE